MQTEVGSEVCFGIHAAYTCARKISPEHQSTQSIHSVTVTEVLDKNHVTTPIPWSILSYLAATATRPH